MRRRIRIGRRWLASGLIVSAVLGGSYAPSAGAAPSSPSPAWQISQAVFPTNLAPGSEFKSGGGPHYEVFVTNVGGAAASGATIIDSLPIGLSPAPAEPPTWGYRLRGSEVKDGTCEVSGQTITCSIATAIPPGASLVVRVPLAVSSDAPPIASIEVSVDGGGVSSASVLETSVTPTPAAFGILDGPAGLSATASDEAGALPVAGAHPFVATFNVGVTKVGEGEPAEAMRNVGVQLPRGLVVNPRATTKRCKMSELALATARNPRVTCPPESQVGQAFIVNEGFLNHVVVPIYNMVPPPGAAAALAFELVQPIVLVRGGVSSDFRLTATSNEIIGKFDISEVALTLWGDPSDPRHDSGREGGQEGPEGCLKEFAGCSVAPSSVPLLTMPTSCGEGPEFSATVDSWLGGHATATRPLTDRTFTPQPIEGCGELDFSPTIESRATTDVADSPSGLEFKIHQPQDMSINGRSTAPLKDVRVTLPEGMTLNAAAANGLAACSEAQMGYQPQGSKIRFATTPQSCPDAAKVGTLEVSTPLLEEQLPGSVYVAKPFDNPFGSLLAIYLAVEDEETGIVAKLAGRVEPDPKTGQLTARFTENPQLPIEDIDLHFFAGDRAALKTPLTCGRKTTTSTLTPWSTPEGADASPTDSFATSVGVPGVCPSTEGKAPNAPSFSAGTVDPLAGAFSPFVLRIARDDGTQRITGIDTTLPQGLLGKLAGVPYCPESAIVLARSREAPEKGKEEQASPSCPAASEVGSVQVTAGVGNAPIPVSGHAYLAGPYKGAPLSLAIVVPAVAGPFDLGNVVNRVALNVGEFDARIHAASDPLPTIIDGIPLDVRSVEVKLDRSGFTLNPTSCEEMAIGGSVTTPAGQTAPLTNRFQVGDCKRLAFKPNLKLRLSGATKRTGHPALKAVLTFPQKGASANIARAQVGLPHSEFLDQANLDRVCKQADLKAGTCPKGSVYGRAKAWSPLLDKPLEGPVYLGVGFGYSLPALVADLNGQIRFLLKGKVDTTKSDGIRNTFEAVPDAPVSRFVLEMKGGPKYGLLQNSENICAKPQRASVAFKAHNGKVMHLTPTIANSCKSKGKKQRGKRGS